MPSLIHQVFILHLFRLCLRRRFLTDLTLELIAALVATSCCVFKDCYYSRRRHSPLPDYAIDYFKDMGRNN
ncbi:unnamed protein product [Lactuca virosa]|uniref:Uncharacterized protein n=1 Tax=Lactuca virosa TaxID=75947 RepID=A0AAU9NSF5_9ASTR|nr:unnamed protein product [Lactuca virosa]